MSQPLSVDDIVAKDVACASSLQFLLRDGRLDALLHMRSNDAFWGLPYDVFLFTMLQELLAAELGLELGVYYHSVTSLHLYTKQIPKARKVVEDTTWRNLEMPPLSCPEELDKFLATERALRLGSSDTARMVSELPDYWRQLASVLARYSLAKQGPDGADALRRTIEDPPYSDVLGGIADKKTLVRT